MAARQNLIGLLEDDPEQAALFRLWLEGHGYATRHYPQAAEFRRKLGAESVDLCCWTGTSPTKAHRVCAPCARAIPSCRCCLTARNEEEHIGRPQGRADDYWQAPKQAELLARVGALLRRVGLGNDQVGDEDAAPYRIDSQRRRVTLNEREIVLTEREFDLALFLFRRRGRVVSRDALLEGVWNIRGDVATRTVDTHISRLRKKLELGGEHGWRLNAVYQHGYRLEQA